MPLFRPLTVSQHHLSSHGVRDKWKIFRYFFNIYFMATHLFHDNPFHENRLDKSQHVSLLTQCTIIAYCFKKSVIFGIIEPDNDLCLFTTKSLHNYILNLCSHFGNHKIHFDEFYLSKHIFLNILPAEGEHIRSTSTCFTNACNKNAASRKKIIHGQKFKKT